MRNQSREIPDHLKSTWDEVNQELSEASIELQEAQERYNKAVLARIALNTALNQITNPE